jgi:hypothetical protein
MGSMQKLASLDKDNWDFCTAAAETKRKMLNTSPIAQMINRDDTFCQFRLELQQTWRPGRISKSNLKCSLSVSYGLHPLRFN